MRRSIVSTSIFLAAAAASVLWIVALTGSASAAARSPHIICPQQAPQIIPCCPLPPQPAGGLRSPAIICCPPSAGATSQAQAQPVCCPTTCCTTTCCPPTASPACCAPTPCGLGTLTISASPNPSRAGQKVVISGALGGSSVAGAQVVLWRKLARQSSFQQAGQTTTDSAGDYTFTLRRGTVMADQEWYVTSSGMQSATMQQHVAALVGLAASTRSTSVGQSIVLHGHVTPSHTGEAVLVEMKRGGAWHLIARPRLGRGSSYKLSLRFTQVGTALIRVVLNADRRNDRSISTTLTVKIS